MNDSIVPKSFIRQTEKRMGLVRRIMERDGIDTSENKRKKWGCGETMTFDTEDEMYEFIVGRPEGV